MYNRKTGQVIKQKIESDSFLLLHFTNVYEDGDYIVMDNIIFNKFTIKGRQQLIMALILHS